LAAAKAQTPGRHALTRKKASVFKIRRQEPCDTNIIHAFLPSHERQELFMHRNVPAFAAEQDVNLDNRHRKAVSLELTPAYISCEKPAVSAALSS
jgi:hypothetical protein